MTAADARSAARYDATDLWDKPISAWHALLRDHLVRAVPADARSVLDVGCGNGNLLNALERVPVRAGTDRAIRGLRHVRAPAVLASAHRLPFADASFDAVVCAEVLEHLDDAILESTVNELQRVARRWIVVSVPNRERREKNAVRCPRCAHVFNAYGHLRSFDEARVRSLFAGFGEPRFSYEGPQRPVSPWLMTVRNRVLGRWFWDPDMVCAACGNTEFPNTRRDPLYRLVEAMNTAMHPRRSWRYWMVAVVERR